MRPTHEDLSDAAEKLSCLRFFPPGDGAKAEIMAVLERMVQDVDRLDWLIATMVDRVGVWYGPVEMRGVYCQKFTPADGVVEWCVETPNFRALDSEAAHTAPFELEKRRELEAPRTKQLSRITEADFTGTGVFTPGRYPLMDRHLALIRARAAEIKRLHLRWDPVKCAYPETKTSRELAEVTRQLKQGAA